MLNLEEIEREIKELEVRGETTYSLCERLAWLYIVRDHIREGSTGISALSGNRTGKLSGSEFLEACSHMDFNELMGILNEHMEAVKVVAPKEYHTIMRKIEDTKWNM